MKENSINNERSSIEKDIHLLESYAGMTHKMTDNQGRPKLDQAIERILLDYKRLRKENEELKKLIAHKNWYTQKLEEDLFENASNYVIKKQKVKDKIEELNQYYKKEIYPNLYQWCDITITEHYDEMIELLQELIEEREKKIK